jgi:thiol-disulfide isomerase/thioredoxin
MKPVAPSSALLFALLFAPIASFGLTACQPGDPSPLAGKASAASSATDADAAQALRQLAMTDLEGQPQSIGKLSDKIIVANYWATWCLPCREEMPAFSRLQTKYAANGVQFVGISIDSADNVKEFQKKHAINYPLWISPESSIEITANLGNQARGLPFTVLMDRNGRISATKLGRFSETDLDAALKKLI